MNRQEALTMARGVQLLELRDQIIERLTAIFAGKEALTHDAQQKALRWVLTVLETNRTLDQQPSEIGTPDKS